MYVTLRTCDYPNLRSAITVYCLVSITQIAVRSYLFINLFYQIFCTNIFFLLFIRPLGFKKTVLMYLDKCIRNNNSWNYYPLKERSAFYIPKDSINIIRDSLPIRRNGFWVSLTHCLCCLIKTIIKFSTKNIHITIAPNKHAINLGRQTIPVRHSLRIFVVHTALEIIESPILLTQNEICVTITVPEKQVHDSYDSINK